MLRPIRPNRKNYKTDEKYEEALDIYDRQVDRYDRYINTCSGNKYYEAKYGEEPCEYAKAKGRY